MNNEPVAECCDDGEGGVYYKTLANKAPIGKLYTHPADLTDEEIENIEHKVYLSTIAKGKPLGSYSKALVKEIIRKANEK